MNYLEFSGLIIFATSFFAACFVYLKDRHNIVNKLWGIMCSLAGIWGLGIFLCFHSQDASSALFWGRFHTLSAVFIPVLFFHFSCALTKKDVIKKKRIQLYYIFTTIYFITAVIFPSTFVVNVGPMFSYNFYPQAGMWYFIFPVFYMYFTMHGASLILLSIFSAPPQQRVKISYLLVGMTIGFISAASSFIPVLGIQLYPIGIGIVPIYVFMVTYAIIKHRLLNIVVIIRWSSIATAIAIMLTTVYSLAIVINEKIILRFTNIELPHIKMLVPVFMGITIIIFYRTIKRFIIALLLTKREELKEDLDELTRYLVTLLDLDEMFDLLICELETILRARCISVLVFNDLDDNFAIKTSIDYEDELKRLDITIDNSLIKWLEKNNKPISKDWLNEEKLDEKQVLFQMELLSAEVCIPIIYYGDFIGVVCLGGRKKRKKYSPDEIDVFHKFTERLAISIKNAITHYRVEMRYKMQIDSLEICGDKKFLLNTEKAKEEKYLD